MLPRPRTPRQTPLPRSSAKRADMTEHPGEQFPPDVDPDVEPGFEPPAEEAPAHPDYDSEPGPQNVEYAEEAGDGSGAEYAEESGEPGHVDPAEVEFGPEFAREPGQ